jgi:hypothetical protein
MRTVRGIVRRVFGRKGRIGRVWLRRSRAGRSYRESGARSRMPARSVVMTGKTQPVYRGYRRVSREIPIKG